jgi:hypothetical protein
MKGRFATSSNLLRLPKSSVGDRILHLQLPILIVPKLKLKLNVKEEYKTYQ